MTARVVPGAGKAEPRGATIVEGGVNFSVYSEHASVIWVCLFDEMDHEIARFELDGHADNCHFGLISGIGAGTRYGLRADGPYEPDKGFHFDPAKLLVDPYAKRVDRTYVRSPRLRLPREDAEDTAPIVPKAIVVQGGRPAQPRRVRPSLIYELNVRQYTMRHPGVQGPLRGTVAALTTSRVLDHLNYLGVTAVELMPVAAWMDDGHLPILGLTNVWGYNPISYFAPDPRIMPRGIQELRAVTDLYRKHGISVYLDVVYNHTGEGNEQGPVVSFMGLDARTYYRHVEVDGKYYLVNDTGTGNTVQCDHPEVRRLVIDSLKHWVREAGVSGFRFDLAPVLGRSMEGFSPDADLLNEMRKDPVLKTCQLIAEPWDPGPGGYQVGNFRGFYEWNDRYRDEIRGFWRGEDHKMGALAARVSGSADIFNRDNRKPSAGVNFLAVHDGFTLRDLVSYADKHNEANGEENRDGHNHNLSWNCGVEGETDDPAIQMARKRDLRALLATLFISRGTTMMQQGDELWRTQQGNNNAYAQDNEITWVDWEEADGELVDYVAGLNAFRKKHAAITVDRFLTGKSRHGHRDVIWWHPEGREMNEGDWHDAGASVVGMQLTGEHDEVLIWFNRRVEEVTANLPSAQSGGNWKIGFSSTGQNPEISGFGNGQVRLPGRSVVGLELGGEALPEAAEDAGAREGGGSEAATEDQNGPDEAVNSAGEGAAGGEPAADPAAEQDGGGAPDKP